jgi:hypothetical protein
MYMAIGQGGDDQQSRTIHTVFLRMRHEMVLDPGDGGTDNPDILEVQSMVRSNEGCVL